MPAGSRSMARPNSSSTSAVPVAELAARLPCLTIVAPHAAATIAAIVEKLTVFAPSPPVPTTSRTSPRTVMGRACSSRTSAAAKTSAAVGPLACTPRRKALTSSGSAWPDMICSTAQRPESASRSSPPSRRPSTVPQVGAAGLVIARPGKAGARVRAELWDKSGAGRAKRPEVRGKPQSKRYSYRAIRPDR